MTAHSNLQTAPAAALLEMLTTRPEVSGFTWTVTPGGVLRGERTDAPDGGRAVTRCAQIMGGTPVRTTLDRDGDSVVLAALATVWRGVNVEVWETYQAPSPRALGTVVVLPDSGPAGTERCPCSRTFEDCRGCPAPVGFRRDAA